MSYKKNIKNWIGGKEISGTGRIFEKISPASGEKLADVYTASVSDVRNAIKLAVVSHQTWSAINVIARGKILRIAAIILSERKTEAAELLSLECGKSNKLALGEVEGAIECAFFFAGEGQRLNGEVLPSANARRTVNLTRESVGVGTLITPFNNPLAGVIWKLFPALLCGNAVVVKSHPDAPAIPIFVAKLLKDAGLPDGVLAVLQGEQEVGELLVNNPSIDFISFTGSVTGGISVALAGAKRLAKVMVESGGKNPFIVLSDADLEKAVLAAMSGSFVDAGQRCAATSRIIVVGEVYDSFKKLFLDKVANLKAGITDSADYGAIVNAKRFEAINKAVKEAVKRGAKIIFGKPAEKIPTSGLFMKPIILENVPPDDPLSQEEIFGPVVALYKAKDFEEAVELANNSRFKLSSAVHTRNLSQAFEFVKRMKAGVVRINGPTHGSESHMPFGGVGLSGNGWREPGQQALDFYSDWKQISFDS